MYFVNWFLYLVGQRHLFHDAYIPNILIAILSSHERPETTIHTCISDFVGYSVRRLSVIGYVYCKKFRFNLISIRKEITAIR